MLQACIPQLSRSALHRCLQRPGMSRWPEVEGDKATRQRLKSYPIGHFHVDLVQGRTEEGKRALWVAIDRTSTFAYADQDFTWTDAL